MALSLGLAATAEDVEDAAGERGAEILERVVDVNRYWLLRPPPAVQRYGYRFRLGDRDPTIVDVDRPNRATMPDRQGITYTSVLHAVARSPETVSVRSIHEQDGLLRLALQFDEPIRGHCGNGLWGSWRGYFTLGGESAEVVVDPGTWTPVQVRLGDVTERFGSYVKMGDGRHAPLRIDIERGDRMTFAWWFRVHQPGLWLLDQSRYGSSRVAWTEKVEVNGAPSENPMATPASLAQQAAELAGDRRVRVLLDANRPWLLPARPEGRALAYRYHQEDGYRESVWWSPSGMVLAQLDADRKGEGPSRQVAWLPDGRRISTAATDPYVKLEGEGGGEGEPDAGLQAVGMGLRLDCALTRLARQPDRVWAEVLPGEEDADRYRLVLHWAGDARLFSGTMLSFTSWAYMHDVQYQRSEILCEASTHRPLHEIDYDGDGKVVGRYWFEDYVSAPDGLAPGRIRATIPHEKDGADQSLEMTATFRQVPEWGWLLREVHSEFRGGGGGSVGRVEVMPSPRFDAVDGVQRRIQSTQRTLQRAANSPEGEVRVTFRTDGSWSPAPLKAARSPAAAESLGAKAKKEGANGESPLVAVLETRLETPEESPARVALSGVTTTYHQEYAVRWTVSVPESDELAAVAESVIRCELRPTPFTVHVPVSDVTASALRGGAAARIQATIEALSGAYHGHGMWYRFTR